MEKISGILPQSARVASVDLKESSPVRPGTPAFGRTEGVSSLRDAKIGQTASRAAKISETQLDWRAKDMQNAATVRDLSDRFFKSNQRAAEPVQDGRSEAVLNIAPMAAARPSVTTGLDLDTVAGAGFQPEMPSTEASQPNGLHPRGSFVDVVA